MRVKVKFGIGITIIMITLSSLAWMGMKESKTYYHTVAELSTLGSSELRQRIRVGGDIVTGSIQYLPGRVDFVLKEGNESVSVSYIGTDPLPDTFKDGAQCLVEGHMMPDDHFKAEQVQAKCASKYEAEPGS